MKRQNITLEEKNKLEEIYQKYLRDERILKMKEISMHRGSSCYVHSFLVAKLAIKKAIKRRKQLDLEAILIASILHDYYLYDWRKDRTLLKHHGANHPYIANENAKRDFAVPEFVSSIILSHMWPYNFKLYPKTTEARIVANTDTFVAFKEALTSKKYKAKKLDKTLQFISTLF